MDTLADETAHPNPRARKRWLWLLAIPAVVLAAPFLLVAAFMTMKLGTELVTRPYFWETEDNDMKVEDLPGNYVLTQDARANSKLTSAQMRDVRIILEDDRSASVSLVPGADAWGDLQNCTWNGTGKWTVFDNQLSIDIDRVGDAASQSCGKNSVNYGFEIMKHHRLWMVVGDPDEGRGLIFSRQ
jgi:hypothetical protein